MAKFKIEDMASLVNGSLYEAAEQANDVRSGIVLQLQENQKVILEQFDRIYDILDKLVEVLDHDN